MLSRVRGIKLYAGNYGYCCNHCRIYFLLADMLPLWEDLRPRKLTFEEIVAQTYRHFAEERDLEGDQKKEVHRAVLACVYGSAETVIVNLTQETIDEIVEYVRALRESNL